MGVPKVYKTKDIIFNSHCDHFAINGLFSFDFKTPTGKEYGVTYRFLGGTVKHPCNYVFEFIMKWCDPELPIDLSEDGLEVHPNEAELELQKIGYSINELFIEELALSFKKLRN